MHSDWTVACGADDPWVVVPWAGKDRTMRYVDLRAAPDALMEIPEAAKFPSWLRRFSAGTSPSRSLFTAKCDVWSYPADLFDGEDLPDSPAPTPATLICCQ